MLNRLLYEFYKSPNNGKQIVTGTDGRRLLLVHSEIMGPAGLSLKRARNREPKTLADFEDLGCLVGPEGTIPDCGTWGFGGCLVAANDTIHLAWTGPHGICWSHASVGDEAIRWSRSQTILSGDYWLGDLFQAGSTLGLTYHLIHDRKSESVGIAWLKGSRWEVQEVHRGSPMFAPVADVGVDGRVHLAWSDVADRLHYARLEAPGSPPGVELLGDGKQPTILAHGDQVLIGCESLYPHIHYYAFVDGKWVRNRFLTWTHDWFMPDLVHSPQLTRDRYGVPWIFFVDNTRRSTFWARWMGSGWGEITNGPRIFYRPPHFDFNLLPIGRICVEKPADTHRAGGKSSTGTDGRGSGRTAGVSRETGSAGASPSQATSFGVNTPDIGMLLTCEPPIERIAYRREPVPDLNAESDDKVLSLDMLEVARAEGVALAVQSARKHPDNPLMELGPQGAFDEDRVFNHGTVILDDGKYRMWYGGIREPRRGERFQPWWDWINCGYAESDDGVHWRRVRVAQVEYNGTKQNNIIPYFRHAPLLMKDEQEPDPARRYKGIYFYNSGEHTEIAKTGKYGKTYDWRDERHLVDLLTSSDGIHWKPHDAELLYPGQQVRPFSAIPTSVFRDDRDPDPAKRFKAYGFMALNLRRRGTSYLFSPDAKQWTACAEMPVIDPAIRGNPPAVGGPTGKVHDTVCFPYEGYYVALYQDQHAPLNMPIELAVSRDAEWLRHVKPGSKVIPLGPAGAFDSMTILPTMPVILDDGIRLYYGGGSETERPGGPPSKWLTQPGLATLRRDGFTAIELVGGADQGVVETIPFRPPQSPRTLHVNANCGQRGSIRAELLDATTGQALPGYSFAECEPVRGDNLDATITWRSHGTLPRASALPKRNGKLQLRFQLTGDAGSPKLHAFWFVS